MNKYFIFTLVSVLLFIPFGLSSKTYAQKKKENKPSPAIEIEKIELNKKELVIYCPYSKYCKKENFSIDVQTTVRNSQNAPLIYEYTVSGGRIVGQGAKVFWNLEGVRPGKYTITVTVDYGRGFINETKSEIVEIKECPVCDLPCVCPTTFDVTASGDVKAGEIVDFTADVSGGTATNIEYDWTVSQGEIIEGQGTSKIKVKTTAEMTGTIEATINLRGDFCDNCNRTKYASVQIIK
jgi:hypothetical protein